MIRACCAFIVVWLALGASAAQADYWGRWDRVGGGWTTGWIQHAGNAYVCGHGAAGCSCAGQNYCGTYPNGAVTIWWPYGCSNPTVWQIRCSIQPIAGPAQGTIGIVSAYYGLNCPQTDPGKTKNITQHVAQTCNGRGQCIYQVNHNVIGDPAYGCRKDFRIQYRCGNAGVKQAFVDPEASGRAAQLSCP